MAAAASSSAATNGLGQERNSRHSDGNCAEYLARLYARSNAIIVLSGETGVGKTYLARLIHEWSGRPGRLIEVTAAELGTDAIARDTLFGHVPGAFTGARGARRGVVAAAAQGTVCLEECHLLPAEVQCQMRVCGLTAIGSSDYWSLRRLLRA